MTLPPPAGPPQTSSLPGLGAPDTAAPTAAERPASQTTATVLRHTQHIDRVELPPRFARETARAYIDRYNDSGRVVMGPADFLTSGLQGPAAAATAGLSLTASQWALVLPRPAVAWLGLVVTHESRLDPSVAALVYPRHTILIERRQKDALLRTLEKVKPQERDASGRPLPWIPVKTRRPDPADADAAAGSESDAEADAVLLASASALPARIPTAPETSPGLIDDATIARWLETLAALAGFSPRPELELVRGRVDHNGFVAGRVWFTDEFRALRVRLVTCPNADLAEVLATLVHELAHPLSRSTGHGTAMRLMLVDLASRQWGQRYFAHARTLAEAPQLRMRNLDYWIATGIRAALRGADAPTPRSASPGDGDDQMARVMSRLKKLRALARDQLGRPEGIAATGAANDLVTLWGLGDYGVGELDIDETQIVDRFVVMPDNAVWRRLLAHKVADFFDVFSLAMPSEGQMHFFGAYADVVAAEYLYSVSLRRIESDCAEHIARWKQLRGRTKPAETRSEKVSFCDCATLEFGKKLSRIRAEDNPLPADERRVRDAEAVALREHRKRGSGWSNAASKSYRENAAGRAAGAAMEVLHGVGARSQPVAGIGLKR